MRFPVQYVKKAGRQIYPRSSGMSRNAPRIGAKSAEVGRPMERAAKFGSHESTKDCQNTEIIRITIPSCAAHSPPRPPQPAELMMAAKTPNPIDVHVGGRVRMRRIEVNMAQQILGGHIGLTFQQIQKYEKGTNRIGASRLQQIGKVLEVPVSYFFEGAPGGWQAGEGGGTANTFLELLGTRDGQLLVLSFSKIADVRLRRSIVDLVERLGAIGGGGSPKSRRAKPKRK